MSESAKAQYFRLLTEWRAKYSDFENKGAIALGDSAHECCPWKANDAIALGNHVGKVVRVYGNVAEGPDDPRWCCDVRFEDGTEITISGKILN